MSRTRGDEGIRAKLPTACACRSLTAIIVDGAFICARCKIRRGDVSAQAQAFLTAITKHFGEPVEPIICRRPNAAKRIALQDAQLKRRIKPEGTSHYDIITENIGVTGENDDGRNDDDNPDRGHGDGRSEDSTSDSG